MSLSPYVPTDYSIVDYMLKMLDLKQGDRLMDIGSGDGRILVSGHLTYGVECIGIEENWMLYQLSMSIVQDMGYEGHIKIINGDARQVLGDFDRTVGRKNAIKEIDAVTMYLTPDGVSQLKTKLEKLRPGCKVLSRDFPIPRWDAEKLRRVQGSTLYLYVIDG